MNNLLRVFDIVDNKIRLNSQVIFNNIGFEIPINYHFNKENTKIEENQFQIIDDFNFKINLKFFIYKKDELNIIIENHKDKNVFKNYREQKIYEIIENDTIKIVGYDDNIFFEVSAQCKKNSQKYYDMYYIAFSFKKIEGEYDNQYLQKNNYCILKNGKFIYENMDVNLIYENPYEYLNKIHKINFNDYLVKNKKYFNELTNYYIKDDFNNVVSKIEKYKTNIINDEDEMMDIIEEI